MLSKIYSGMIWKHARFSLKGNFSMTLTWGSEEMDGAAKAIEAIKGYRQSLGQNIKALTEFSRFASRAVLRSNPFDLFGHGLPQLVKLDVKIVETT